MKISIDLPDNFLSVQDTQNYKGNPVTVLRIMGKESAYYIGRSSILDNRDWEEVFKNRIADFFGKMFAEQFPEEWSTTNPTGRELNDEYEINFVREEF